MFPNNRFRFKNYKIIIVILIVRLNLEVKKKPLTTEYNAELSNENH